MSRSKVLLLMLLIVVLLGIKFNMSKKFFRSVEKTGEMSGNWAEQTLQALSLREKIGQLLVVRVYASNPLEKLMQQTTRDIEQYHVGGLLVFQYIPKQWHINLPGMEGERQDIDPQEVVTMLNHYQKLSKVPLLVTIDAEWGLGMTFQGAIKYPKNMTLGAVRDERLVYEVGKEIGRQCRMLGIHLNFAPVVDINTNPRNPIIGRRSFGDDKHVVARRGMLYMQGLQHSGVLSCAKHFPGHGDTTTDSHKDLPVLEHSLERLYDIELSPFRRLVKHGVDSVMVAHLSVPELDGDNDRSSCLSKNVVTNLLKRDIGFNGLIFSDAFFMKAVSKFYSPGEAEVLAFKAGIDVIVLPKDVSVVINAVEHAVEQGVLSESDIDERVLKVLRAKEKLGLHKHRTVASTTLAQLNTSHALSLKRTVFRKAVTLISSHDTFVPLRCEEMTHVAVVQVGGEERRNKLFEQQAKRYHADRLYYLPQEATQQEVEQVLDDIRHYDRVIVGLMLKMNPYGLLKNLSKSIAYFMDHMKQREGNKHQEVIAGFFTTPYVVSEFEDIADTVFLVHQKDPYAVEGFFDAVFGQLEPEGQLPLRFL